MSYNRRITVLYGVRLPQLSSEEWEEKLNDFLSTDFGLNSGIVGNCAEYNEIDRSEVDSELLYEYLTDWKLLINCEFLDSDFLGEEILTIYGDGDSDWRDLREISEQTFDMGVIGQLVYVLFPLATPMPYLINWVI
jgi:hypothetical protein